MNIIKTIKNWWWQQDPDLVEVYLLFMNKKLDRIESKIDNIDKITNSYLYNRWSASSSTISVDENNIDNVTSTEDINSHHDDEYDTDGSNLAIYAKANINDTTRLQYVTGHRDKFNTRKRLYDDGVMEKIYEANNLDEPAAKISKIEQDIINCGKRVEHIDSHGTIVYANNTTIKPLVKEAALK
ncbi:38.7 kDa protein [Mocis latipes granulovirus]|uniref:38.7 kDa protein n=1 Tax=Mocis latipes granulovirus TaxID=2072024 RepID=A0A162GWS4_9BBAC|nr:38.7 kDa protein [Mocis latipes granulovirus]AKR17507.1 38.7 kDa protein [Mocis latipes granulovirus]